MPEPSAPEAAPGWACAVCAGLEAVDCRDVIVPDNPLAHVLRTLAADHPGIRTTLATREEEAFGIAAGVYLGGGRAVLLQSPDFRKELTR